MNLLPPLFEDFASRVYPFIPPEQRHALERSFYVGAAALIQAQHDVVKDAPAEDGKDALNELIREVQNAITRLSVDYGDPSLN